jgi:DNA-3-methyladenine glycosylase II
VQNALSHLKKSDPILAAIIERVGPCNIQYREPEFASLVRSIVFQQLSGKSATPIFNRLVEACGGQITPDAILKLRTPRLRKVGLSRQKISYIRDLAKSTQAGKLDFAALPDLPDQEIIQKLTAVKGIGEWTAHMFLLFALRRENVLPVGDFGVRNAIRKAYRKRKLPSPTQMEKLAKNWHPYCSIASWYLWRSLELPAAPVLGDCRPPVVS